MIFRRMRTFGYALFFIAISLLTVFFFTLFTRIIVVVRSICQK